MSPTDVPGTTRRPATMGAKMTDAPMVATQPPSTAPHAVAAGRETTFEYATKPSYEPQLAVQGQVQACKYRARKALGQAARRALPSRRPRGPALGRGHRCAPRADLGPDGRNARTPRSAGRSAGAAGSSR